MNLDPVKKLRHIRPWHLLLLHIATAGSAQALTIRLVDIGATPMSTQRMDALEMAASIWESRLDDDADLVINVAFDPPEQFSDAPAEQSSEELTIATTWPALTTHSWPMVAVTRMLHDADSVEEIGALSGLPGSHIPITNPNGNRDAVLLSMTTANAKALGLSSGRDPRYTTFPINGADGSIRFNDGASWNTVHDGGYSGDAYDLVTVAMHEIGHVLCRPERWTCGGSPNPPAATICAQSDVSWSLAPRSTTTRCWLNQCPGAAERSIRTAMCREAASPITSGTGQAT